MPQVPRLQGQQIQQQGYGNARVNTDAPAEAFGGGQAQDRLAAATQSLATQSMQIFKDEKKKANDIATQDAWAKTTQEMNRLKYDPKAGALNRRGKDAFNVSEEYGQQFDQFANSVEEGLSDEEQRGMYRQMRQKMRVDFSGDLEKHTFQEAKRYEDETTENTVNTSIADAVQNYQDPAKVARNLEIQKSVVTAHASRNGLDPEAQIQSVLSKTHTAVIGRMLQNGDTKRAEEYFTANKETLGTAVTAVEKQLKDKQFEDLTESTWNDLKGARLADGSADFGLMQKRIDSMALEPEKKRSMLSHIEARATDADRIQKREEASTTHSLMNQAIKLKSQGVPLEKALEIVPQFGGDGVLKRERSEVVAKMFTKNIQTDPDTYMRVWEMARKNDPKTQAELMAALRSDKVSASDSMEILKLAFNEDEQSNTKVINTVIDEETKSLNLGFTGAAKKERDDYKFTLMMKTRGKSPEEARLIAKEMKKEVITSKGWIWDSKEEAFKGERMKLDKDTLAKAEMQRKLGGDLTDIAGGPSGIDSFQARTGVTFDKLTGETPERNAILSLAKLGKRVDRQTLDAVLKRYPDGVIK